MAISIIIKSANTSFSASHAQVSSKISPFIGYVHICDLLTFQGVDTILTLHMQRQTSQQPAAGLQSLLTVIGIALGNWRWVSLHYPLGEVPRQKKATTLNLNRRLNSWELRNEQLISLVALMDFCLQHSAQESFEPCCLPRH